MKQTTLLVTLVATMTLPAGGCAPGAIPSHLRPHLYDHAPAVLLEPIGDGDLLKGWSTDDEKVLCAELEASELHQRVVKIAVLRGAGLKLAAIKLQAGEWSTGRFSLRSLHEDALRVMQVAFDGAVQCDHLDLWAAVAWRGEDGETWHWPLFSLSTWRESYHRARAASGSAQDLLARVSLIRYDPLLLDYVLDPAERVPEAITLPMPNLDATGGITGETTRSICEAMRAGSPASNTVAITLDDGPHPVITPLILRVLQEANVRATFFLVGEKILQYPQLFRDIVTAGQEVGNHTFTHRRLTRLTPAAIRAELYETTRLMMRLGAPPCRIMRPPGGDFDEAALKVCCEQRLLPVFWTRNTGDWKGRPVREVVRSALQDVRPGDVILLHQGGPDCVPALGEILAGLKAMGLQPGCVGDILPGAPLFTGNARQVLAQLRANRCLVNE
ncbi:MAG: polysaccharide deacetylase family protein [Armatimonadetes bacterium]|nr:polysaccharide deacetylase family protein [Armatimonadota bacterium]